MEVDEEKFYVREQNVLESILEELEPRIEEVSTINLAPGVLVNLDEIERSKVVNCDVLSDLKNILWEDASGFTQCTVKQTPFLFHKQAYII